MKRRASWGARARAHHPGVLERDDVIGLAFHWPAIDRPIARDEIAAALRGWQDYHMDGHGWSDIGYQLAIDQWGRVWELRGLTNRSAANGGTGVNGRYGAVLLILAAGEQPSEQMLDSTRGVVSQHRQAFPRSRDLVGHGAIRPGGGTECPGAVVERLLENGSFEPTEGKQDMASGDQLDRIERKVDDTRQAVGALRGKLARRYRTTIRELRGQGKSGEQVLELLEAELERDGAES